jgi:hypothetical protein
MKAYEKRNGTQIEIFMRALLVPVFVLGHIPPLWGKNGVSGDNLFMEGLPQS